MPFEQLGHCLSAGPDLIYQLDGDNGNVRMAAVRSRQVTAVNIKPSSVPTSVSIIWSMQGRNGHGWGRVGFFFKGLRRAIFGPKISSAQPPERGSFH